MSLETYQFVVPFAEGGDKSAIPEGIQPSGEVSFTTGYGFDYSRPVNSDPQAKEIERLKMNQLFFSITQAIRAWQLGAFPQWDSENIYPLGVMVRNVGGALYRSLKDNNSDALGVVASWELQKTDAQIAQDIEDAFSFAVPRDSTTGAGTLPAGTTAERPATPIIGMARRNTQLGMFEGYTGTAWEQLGGGATGGNGDKVIYLNDQTIDHNYTIPTGQNGGTFGPVTVMNGATLTVPNGSTYSVV